MSTSLESISASRLWHASQYAEHNRSTTHLREFVSRVLDDRDPPTEVLDAGCGGGAKMLHLSDMFPEAHWTGVDNAAESLEIGRKRLDPKRFELLHGDLTDLERLLGHKRFDICFSIMVLSGVEDYERAIDQMFAVTRKHLFVLSLFAETELDAFIRINGRMAGAHQGLTIPYNIYSLPRFEEFCRQLGAKEILAEPFEIDIDIPRPDHGGMGTWTEQTQDGRRLQISGPLMMPWWFISIQL